MNIVVKTHSGRCIVRPDTTWERDNEDVFLPEFVDEVTFSPVLFARISKPGRSIAAKFADRYYDSIGYGVLLYPENMIEGEEGFAAASCLDHSSFLPFPLYNKVTLGREDNIFSLEKDGIGLFSCPSGLASDIEAAIEEATKYIYIRTGDVIAIELDVRKPLLKRSEGECSLHGSYCGNEIIDFKVIL